jgi:RNA polymerase sigma-70 factor (ECF subfamily)
MVCRPSYLSISLSHQKGITIGPETINRELRLVIAGALDTRSLMSTENLHSDVTAASPEASAQLFERFARRLIGLARTHLDARMQNKVDPEDIVQSVYKSFYLRYGDVPLDEENGGLWNLLTVITLRKCADRVRYFRTERRDMSREIAPAGDEGSEPWRALAGREPTPDQAVALAETVERLLGSLDSDERPILELSLQGYSTQEISQQLGRAERSVRRLRERIRKQLERMQTDASA